jgi:hypothetical protein
LIREYVEGSLMDNAQQAISFTSKEIYPLGWEVYHSEEVGAGTVLITLKRINRHTKIKRVISSGLLRDVEKAVSKAWAEAGGSIENVTARDRGPSMIEITLSYKDRTGMIAWDLP